MDKRKGFTLIEVTLFLAVTAALFIGIALGMNNAIYQQRRNDSVQNFLEFMRSIYSKVSNPQGQGAGNSEQAIYGKMVVFGENKDLQGEKIDYSEGSATPVFVYDLIGKAETKSSEGGVIKSLKEQGVSPFIFRYDGANITGALMADPEKYEPRWGAAIEDTGGEIFIGTILVVKHPKFGTINTLVSKEVIQVNEEYHNMLGSDGSIRPSDLTSILTIPLNEGKFETSETDFCVNPNGLKVSAGMVPRQDIRIANNARNASSVKLIDLDDKSSDSNKDGNRCYR
ncbi:prepilin-type N-terminal cleavage/methylation domain-containing protein [Candidatus Saccharibacteria bacterium]|nr:prepilin-type N-terminal cleavage/methylation domain-containing protein [Candidatus Saccharibacteria bacterium]